MAVRICAGRPRVCGCGGNERPRVIERAARPPRQKFLCRRAPPAERPDSQSGDSGFNSHLRRHPAEHEWSSARSFKSVRVGSLPTCGTKVSGSNLRGATRLAPTRLAPTRLLAGSTTVVRLAVNQQDGGSNPLLPAKVRVPLAHWVERRSYIPEALGSKPRRGTTPGLSSGDGTSPTKKISRVRSPGPVPILGL